MIILVIGDLHTPQRCLGVPDAFLELLAPGKVHKIICTGNLTTHTQLKWLQGLCRDIIFVSGDYDESMPDAKETATLKVGSINIGVIHGHQIQPWGEPERLRAIADELDVDVLISGQTHTPSVSTCDGKLLINPGSLTGAYSCTSAQSQPSCMVLDIQKDRLSLSHYLLNNEGEISVTQYNHVF